MNGLNTFLMKAHTIIMNSILDRKPVKKPLEYSLERAIRLRKL